MSWLPGSGVVDTLGGGFTKKGAELSETTSSAASSLPAEQVLRKAMGFITGVVQSVSLNTLKLGAPVRSRERREIFMNEKKRNSTDWIAKTGN